MVEWLITLPSVTNAITGTWHLLLYNYSGFILMLCESQLAEN